MVALTRRARHQRVHALANEIATLKRVCAVAMRDKQRALNLLAEASRDVRNGVPLAQHLAVAQKLHVAQDRLKHLEERHGLRA